ncbi:hypothetical protein E8E12_001932 [Didymella heteroderae]|uniref:Carboxylic ester hydrolase n=1 Tax=Didymella heteroderae TaxID=1769908 RepID=A0A9P4WGY2_9PLEO|nr:hypothetical protein E8E12_001932 [Didymella heteroderae]
MVVTLNYRLNMFAFGDGDGEKNLALSDQRAALEFVRQHIGGFGGDPRNITLAGESAGAVYVHAHMVMGVPMRQAVLQSGSLYLSPPIPEARAKDIVARIEDRLSLNGSPGLREASAEDILNAQADLGLVSLFLRMEPGLEKWRDELGHAERLLIGDCEYESAIWRNGVEALSAESICRSFDLLGDESASLKAMYGIHPGRPASCKIGALDLLHDVRFTVATEKIVEQWHAQGRHVFRYLVDEANPWQPSNRAHHTVDLPLLFGGFDLSFNSGAYRVSSVMSRKWIEFSAGMTPWEVKGYYAFGPLGNSMLIDEDGFAVRRRKRHCDAIKKIGVDRVDEVWKALAINNVSFEN